MADDKKNAAPPAKEGQTDYSDLDSVREKYGPEPTDPKESSKYHARIIADARAQQQAQAPVPDTRRYGVFASNPQKFVVQHEMVGGHVQGKEISYRDLILYKDPEHTEVDFVGTVDNADRLVALGALRPLVIIGEK